MYYYQCRLRRGETFQTAYIPEKFAKPHNRLKIKKDDGTWEEGWFVQAIYYNSKVDEKMLPDSHKSTKEHRKRTGDSLPKVDDGLQVRYLR